MHRWLPGGSSAQAYYRPVQVVVASLVHAVAGKSPRAFRSVSLALGGLTLALFTAWVWWLIGRPEPALAAGLLLAAHPTGIETYVWIASLSEVLADLFVIGSVLALATLATANRRGVQVAAAVAAVACGLAAVLSKENGAVVPLLGLGLLAALAVGGAGPAPTQPVAQRWRQLALRLGPVLVLQALLAALVLGPWRQHVLGGLTGGAAWIGSPGLQWRTAIALWPRLFAWLIAPLSSTTSDTVPLGASWLEPGVLLGVGLVLASATLIVVWLRRGHGTAALGLFWLWAAHLPTAGLLPTVHLRGERYLHLSLFGLALLLAVLVALGLRGRPSATRRAALAALIALLIAGLAERTLERQPDWRSSQTLFASDLAREPGYREGRLQLALAELRAGDAEQAWQTLRPLAENPMGDPTTTGFFGGMNLAGLICQVAVERGRFDEALQHLERVAQRTPAAVATPSLRWCRARALAGAGRPADAAQEYQALLASLGDDAMPELRLTLAWTLLEAGQSTAAARQLDALPPAFVSDPQLAPELSRLRRAIAAGRPRP
jgi:hypothetical protein